MKQFIKEVIHNCLVHPVLPFLPKKWAKAFHDVNANWAFPPANPAKNIRMPDGRVKRVRNV